MKPRAISSVLPVCTYSVLAGIPAIGSAVGNPYRGCGIRLGRERRAVWDIRRKGADKDKKYGNERKHKQDGTCSQPHDSVKPVCFLLSIAGSLWTGL